MDRQYIEIKVDEVVLKKRLREDHGDIASLESSVRRLGVITPIIVDKDNVLIAGARRLEACRRAGITAIPAIKLDISYDSMTALDLQADLNLCREPLSDADLERHIAAKKKALSADSTLAKGMVGRLTKLFSHD